MREATARVEWLREVDARTAAEEPEKAAVPRAIHETKAWSPERFAHEQMRRLVRQVFFSSGPIPVRQVVFSAADAETDVETICARAGEVLSEETTSDIAVVGGNGLGKRRERSDADLDSGAESVEAAGSGLAALDGSRNLWFLPAREGTGWGARNLMKTYLDDIRREFPYSIVQGPSMGDCEALPVAESTDGMILVLSAQHTRRVAATRIRQVIADAQVRLLGTVLTDREFPIPEKIYRRL